MLYIADTNNQRIRQVMLATGNITTLAGNGQRASNDGSFATASLCTPHGLAQHPATRVLFVSERDCNRVRTLDLSTQQVSGFVGSGGSGSSNGVGNANSFSGPQGIALSAALHALFIADTGNALIRRCDVASATCVTFLDSVWGSDNFADGTLAPRVNPSQVQRVAFDPTGTRLYWTEDQSRRRVRWVNVTAPPSAQNATTLAGIMGQTGFSGDLGFATAALISYGNGLAVQASTGLVLFSDYQNNRVRAVGPAACEMLRLDAAGPMPNITITATPYAWHAAPGVTIPCLWDSASPVPLEQQALQAGYRFALALNDSGRVVRFPCAGLRFFLANSPATPPCQKRSQITCVLPGAPDAGNLRVLVQLVAPAAGWVRPDAPVPAGTALQEIWQDGGAGVSLPAPTITAVDHGAFTDAALQVTLSGTNFGPVFAAFAEPPALVLAGTPCDNVTVASAALLTATCNTTAALWNSSRVPGSLRVAGVGLNFTLTMRLPPPLRLPATLWWGQSVSLAGRGIGLSGLQRVALLPDAPPAGFLPQVPCAALAAVDADHMTCVLRLLHEGLILKPFTVMLSYGGGLTANYSSSALGASIPRPHALSMTAPRLLNRAGGDRIVLQLPAGRITQADYIDAGLLAAYRAAADVVSVSIAGATSTSSCLPLTADTVECSAPPGGAVFARVVVGIGAGPYNITSDAVDSPDDPLPPWARPGSTAAIPANSAAAYVTYQPPGIGTYSPAALLVAPVSLPAGATASAPVLVNVTFTGVESLAAAVRGSLVSAIKIGAAWCRSLEVAGSTVNCTSLNTTALLGAAGRAAALASGATTVQLPLTFVWGSITAQPTVLTGYFRPRVSLAIPTSVAAGSRFTISGVDLCPLLAGVCAGAQDVSVLVAGQACTGLQVVNAATLTCAAPALATLPATWPAAAVTVRNAAGAESIDAVSIVYPSQLAVVWADTGAAAPLCPPAIGYEGSPLPMLPAPALRVIASGNVSCSVRVDATATVCAASPARTAVGVAVAGVYAQRTGAANTVGVSDFDAGSVNGTTALPLANVAVRAGMGCSVSLVGSCSDASGEQRVTTGVSQPVHTPRLYGNWSDFTFRTLAAGAPFTPASAAPASVVALLAWDAPWPPAGTAPAAGWGATAASLLSCTAKVAGAGEAFDYARGLNDQLPYSNVVSASDGRAVFGGDTAGLDTGAASPLFSGGRLFAAVTFSDLSLLRCNLGAEYVLYAECVWTATNDRLLLPPLRLPLLAAAVHWQAQPSEGTALQVWAQPASWHREPAYVSASAAAAAAANATLFADAAGFCVWTVPASNATAGALRLSQESQLARFSVAANGSVLAADGSPGPVLLLDGRAGDSFALQLQCTLWGRLLASAVLTVDSAPLRLRVNSALPSTFLPSDASLQLPLDPPISVSLLDGGGAPISGVTCTLSAAQSAVPVRRAADAASGTVVTAADSAGDGVVVFDGVVLIATFAARRVTLSVSCARDNSQESNEASWNVTIVPLAMAVCSPPQATTSSQEAMGWWHVAVGPVPPELLDSPERTLQGAAGALCTRSRLRLPDAIRSNVLCSVDKSPATPAAAAIYATAGAGPWSGVTLSGESANATLFLQGAAQTLDASGAANFTSLTLTGLQNTLYALQVGCRLGGVSVPQAATVPVKVLGCRAGYIPVNFLCSACPAGTYSRGGDDVTCHSPPMRGAVVAGGDLQLLPGYYRPPSEVGQPISEASHLYACLYPDSCVLQYNASASAVPTYGCAEGWAATLCGACRTPEYSFFGKACSPCLPAAVNRLIVFLIVAVLVGLLLWVALKRSTGERSPASIVLRMLLTFLQAIGAIKSFKAGGTAVFRSAFGWTETISASPFSFGPLSCALQWTYVSRMLLVLLSPFTAAAAVMVFFAVISLARSVRWRVLAARCRLLDACACRRGGPVSTQGPRRGADGLLLQPSELRQAGASFSDGAPGAVVDVAGWRHALREWWEQRRPVNVLLFVLNIAYMPIVSTCIGALDCYEEPIDGVRYLRADMSVPCFQGQHVLARVLAICFLCGVGVGFPLWLFLTLWRATEGDLQRPGFRNVWLSMYDGFRGAPASEASAHITLRGAAQMKAAEARRQSPARRAVGLLRLSRATAAPSTPKGRVSAALLARASKANGGGLAAAAAADAAAKKSAAAAAAPGRWCAGRRHMLWWESTVFLRKMCTVLLASLLTDASLQLVGFSLLALLFLVVQLQLQPYQSKIFNRIEALTILATLMTALFSFLLTGAASDLIEGGAAATGSASSASGVTLGSAAPGADITDSTKRTIVSASLLGLNVLTAAALALLYLLLQCGACCRSAATRRVLQRAGMLSADAKTWAVPRPSLPLPLRRGSAVGFGGPRMGGSRLSVGAADLVAGVAVPPASNVINPLALASSSGSAGAEGSQLAGAAASRLLRSTHSTHTFRPSPTPTHHGGAKRAQQHSPRGTAVSPAAPGVHSRDSANAEAGAGLARLGSGWLGPAAAGSFSRPSARPTPPVPTHAPPALHKAGEEGWAESRYAPAPVRGYRPSVVGAVDPPRHVTEAPPLPHALPPPSPLLGPQHRTTALAAAGASSASLQVQASRSPQPSWQARPSQAAWQPGLPSPALESADGLAAAAPPTSRDRASSSGPLARL